MHWTVLELCIKQPGIWQQTFSSILQWWQQPFQLQTWVVGHQLLFQSKQESKLLQRTTITTPQGKQRLLKTVFFLFASINWWVPCPNWTMWTCGCPNRKTQQLASTTIVWLTRTLKGTPVSTNSTLGHCSWPSVRDPFDCPTLLFMFEPAEGAAVPLVGLCPFTQAQYQWVSRNIGKCFWSQSCEPVLTQINEHDWVKWIKNPCFYVGEAVFPKVERHKTIESFEYSRPKSWNFVVLQVQISQRSQINKCFHLKKWNLIWIQSKFHQVTQSCKQSLMKNWNLVVKQPEVS